MNSEHATVPCARSEGDGVTSRHRRVAPSTMKKLLISMAIGAALAWAFDPDQGSRRREQVKHRLEEKGVLGSSSTPTPVSTYQPSNETLSA